MEVAVNPNCSIVAELKRSGGHLVDGKNSADNNTLFDIALLRDEKNLVTWLRGQAAPQPFPTHCDTTGSHPDKTPSGWMTTRAVALLVLTDVTVPNLTWPADMI